MPSGTSVSRPLSGGEIRGERSAVNESRAIYADKAWLDAALVMPGESRFTTIDGNRIHYLVWGAHSADKPTLLLVHGMRGHAHWWDAIAPALSSEYRVIAPDLSGMGDSGRREVYGWAVYARDIIGLLERECSQPIVAIGHSYGGACTLHASFQRPELFQRVILVDTYVMFDGEMGPQDIARSTHRVYPDLALALRRFRLLPDQPTVDAGYLEHMARWSLRPVNGGFSWKFDANVPAKSVREGDTAGLLTRIDLPVDYVCGERSALIDARRAEAIVKALPRGGGPIVIPNGHHHLMLDQPIALVATLRALLARRSL